MRLTNTGMGLRTGSLTTFMPTIPAFRSIFLVSKGLSSSSLCSASNAYDTVTADIEIISARETIRNKDIGHMLSDHE